MLDIGMPEFLVIAIVALVVLGPERLPEVMRRGGQLYRQARELMAQYTSEAQRMFDEGMREVEDVSNTINSAWESATSSDTTQAPPALRQLPPPLQQPSSAADAGPWLLPATHRDGVAEGVGLPPGAAPVESPFVLQRLAPPAGAGPLPTSPGLATTDARDLPEPVDLPDLPDLPDTPDAVPAIPPIPIPVVAAGPALTDAREPAVTAVPQPEVAPVTVYAANGTAPGPAHTNGSSGAGVPGADAREQTVIDLYLQGDLGWQKAAEYLGLAPEAFLDRVERVRRATRAR